jgi:formylmethanofuran dehydrogenase subunit E
MAYGIELDPDTDLANYEEEKQEWLDRLPRCCDCGEPIQDEDMYIIGEDIYCPRCIERMRTSVDSYMEGRA